MQYYQCQHQYHAVLARIPVPLMYQYMRSGLTFTSTRMPTMGNPALQELQSDAQTHAAGGVTMMCYFKAEATIAAVSL